jgi:ATP-dependent DNA helicase RecG
MRYQDRTRIVPIGQLRAGEECTIQGEVLYTEIRYARRRLLVSRIDDGSGAINLKFFNFSTKQKAGLEKGVFLSCFGSVQRQKQGLEMIHPEYHCINPNEAEKVSDFLTPIYPATEGLRQATFRHLIDQLVLEPNHLSISVSDLLPQSILEKLNYPRFADALAFVHRPPKEAEIEKLQNNQYPAQQRLAFEELLAHHLSLRQIRFKQQRHAAPVLNPQQNLQQQLLKQLPFQLTIAQQRVLNEVLADLSRPHPMQRLIQGDVGCGKTVVAALSAVYTADSGYQVAVMAPTEILAIQHFRNFQQWLEPLNIQIALLTSKIKGKARQAVLEKTAAGEIKMIIGTQALYQESVEFENLGLVIIDEQHRFGVHQRLALRNKGGRSHSKINNSHVKQFPHQLIMTATPIPRTLTMVAYADLDCSIIDELPPGRSAVETVVVPEDRRDDVIQRVHAACRDGRQSYWVCTLIEESEQLQCQAAEEAAKKLRELLPDIKIELIHGRKKAAEKEQIMRRFKENLIDLLVATTVIEVGVDVPNASLMIVDNAERLGMSQLHQLRGRVGRGAIHSVCVLLYHGPLSQLARQRLATLRETNDGFEVARRDLELRGPGEVLGTRQAGIAQFRIADLSRDQRLVEKVPASANVLLEQYPEQVDRLVVRWLGKNTEYADV